MKVQIEMNSVLKIEKELYTINMFRYMKETNIIYIRCEDKYYDCINIWL